MNNSEFTNPPWFEFLIRSLIACFFAVLILSVIGALIAPILRTGNETNFDWSMLVSFEFWVGVFFSALWGIIQASIVLIPSFYAGMFSCLRLERRGANYQKQFETTFRVVSTLSFFALSAIVLIVLFSLDMEPLNIALDAVQLLIIFYIFDENVIEALWPRVFLKRNEA